MSITYPRLFADDWLITHDYEEEVLGIVKMGKESEVSLIARSDATRTCYIAEKRFKSRGFRAFRDDFGYRSTWFQGPGGRRARTAMLGGTRFGRQIVESVWYAHEWTELNHLYEAGVTVPPPVELLPPTKRPAKSFHWRPINAAAKADVTRRPRAPTGWRSSAIRRPLRHVCHPSGSSPAPPRSPGTCCSTRSN